jgi:hypothetical protein
VCSVVYIVFPLSFGKRASGLSSFSVVIHIVPILFQLFACFPLLRGEGKDTWWPVFGCVAVSGFISLFSASFYLLSS